MVSTGFPPNPEGVRALGGVVELRTLTSLCVSLNKHIPKLAAVPRLILLTFLGKESSAIQRKQPLTQGLV